MAIITINQLVSRILEQINRIPQLDKPMYFKSLGEIINYFDLPQELPYGEIDEMANKRLNAQVIKLDQPMRIPVVDLDPTSKIRTPIISLDPDTNELVNGVIIGDEIVILESNTRPEGLKCLKFQNYAGESNSDRPKKAKEWVVLPEKYFSHYEPRSKRWGTEYRKPDYSIPVPGENERRMKTRENKDFSNNERWAKYYVINPSINNLFSRPDILNTLDLSLIPEIWAGPLRTERTTNREILFSFGGNRPTINLKYNAVRDFEDEILEDGTIIPGIAAALNDIINIRLELENGNSIEARKRYRSKFMPRTYSGNARWSALQRIYDESEFKKAGEYTKILKLLKKNSQKGRVGFNTESILTIEGDIRDNDYVLRCKFEAEMNFRAADEKLGKNTKNLITPIYASVIAPLPQNIDPEEMTIRNNKEFFGVIGTTGPYGVGSSRGIFQNLMNKLGEEIINKIDPNVVLTTISRLLNPENISNVFIEKGEF